MVPRKKRKPRTIEAQLMNPALEAGHPGSSSGHGVFSEASLMVSSLLEA
jgi:hypothetical protein